MPTGLAARDSSEFPVKCKTAPGGLELRANVARTPNPEAYPFPIWTPKGGAMRIPVSSDARLIDPAVDLAATPFFDFAPECAHANHQGDEPAAYWCDAHGCSEIVLCSTCLARIEKKQDFLAKALGYIRCPYCSREGACWRDLVRIVPIGGAR